MNFHPKRYTFRVVCVCQRDGKGMFFSPFEYTKQTRNRIMRDNIRSLDENVIIYFAHVVSQYCAARKKGERDGIIRSDVTLVDPE